jgi:hypothetical protein
VDWKNACPNWINTTEHVDATGGKYEEPFMKEAFLKNFPNETLPKILAQPCCSQFAVTKAAIRSIPQDQYKNQTELLMKTDLDDHLSGRIWEHLWQYLFSKKRLTAR